MTYTYDMYDCYDPADPVAGTVVNALRSVLADTVTTSDDFHAIIVADAVTVGTGGGCSASVANVIRSINGHPHLMGQLVMWEHDVAPTNPWLPMSAAWYPAGALYEPGPDDPENDVIGSAEPGTVWGEYDNAPECLAAMMPELVALITC